MVKTTVYLPDDLKRKIARAAAVEGRSEAAVIRSALDRYTSEEGRLRPRAPLVDTLGDAGLSERVDEALAGFGRD